MYSSDDLSITTLMSLQELMLWGLPIKINLDLEIFKVRRRKFRRVLVYKMFYHGNAQAAEVDHCVVSVKGHFTMFQAGGKIVDINLEQERAEDASLRNADLDRSQRRLDISNRSELKASNYVITSTDLLQFF